METRIITIANNKGGVAKTTTAFNIAKCLYLQHHKKILLIDLDPQANLTTMAGVEKDTLPNNSIAQIFYNKETDIKKLILTIDGIDYIISTSDLQQASELAIIQGNSEHRLETKLKQVKDLYDYIIIDTPPNFSILTKNGIIASTEIIIPLQAEHLALHGTADILNFIENINHDLEDLDRQKKIINGTIITLYDKRTALAQTIEQEARQILKENNIKTFTTIINRNTRIAEAPRENKSIIEYDTQSQGAKDYTSLAAEIIKQEKGR